jgi:hypothetical protein
MSLNSTVTKKSLETIVHETFCNFGFLSSSSLLDSLKLLGFYYATNAGISINIEDLKTPDLKKDYIEIANQEIAGISQLWAEGIVSDQERFQSIIDSWNIATESLKNRIVDYYQNFDPANNLYIMAFSGARGNMSQVRQLVGMRGLMSDQEGKIIDLPIQANFREGLSSIDYIISSYGARKGIVDTALKTADSGYLTRRLIYLAQDLIIRELDCKTKNGVLVLLKKDTSIKNLVGRQLLSVKKAHYPYQTISELSQLKPNSVLETEALKELKLVGPLLLNIRSSLTCKSNGSICQKCYGWDLAHQKLIGLGETVGIIAAQSIGEPGTQLTMRTFHTGGIFTGEALKQFVAPFSGKIIIPPMLKTFSFRTNHGINVLKLQQEASIKLINWKGIETTLFLEIGSYLYLSKTTFVYKGQLISEFLTQSLASGQRKLKPIYTRISGKVLCNTSFPTFRRKKKGKTRRIVLKQGLLWIAAGKILPLPVEAEYLFEKNLHQEKAIARLKISIPKEGMVLLNGSSLSILTNHTKMEIHLSDFKQNFKNCLLQIVPLVKNYQYVDAFTIVAFIYIFPNFAGEIVSIEKKQATFFNIFFISTNKEIWNLYGPLGALSLANREKKGVSMKHYSVLESFLKLEREKERGQSPLENQTPKNNPLVKSRFNIISPNTFKNPILKIRNCGLNLKQDRYFHSFQQLEAICLPTSTILNYLENDLVLEKKVFATLVNYSQQTDDIVQGLPKIEELVEARKPKTPSCLAVKPGIFLHSYLIKSKTTENKIFEKYSKFYHEKKLFKCLIPLLAYSKKKNTLAKEDLEEKEEKQMLLIAHSFLAKKNIIENQGYFFSLMFFSGFKSSFTKKEYEMDKKSLVKLNISAKKWLRFPYLLPQNKEIFVEFLKVIFQYFNKTPNQIEEYIEKKQFKIYKSVPDKKMMSTSKFKCDYIFQLSQNTSIYLKHIELPVVKYPLLATAKLLVQKGDFIDIAEPISDGIMDSHELLKILFVYHSNLDGIIDGTLKSLNKFQLILVNSIQAIYQAQGVNISTKHIEIIVRQMTSKVIIKSSGDTPFLPGELLPMSLVIEMYEALKTNVEYKTPTFEPKLLSATNSSLNKDGFLSAAGFQETRKILTKAAIEGSSDWLRGLKESLMSGRMIPAGSAFLNYKNYLDNLYFLKN